MGGYRTYTFITIPSYEIICQLCQCFDLKSPEDNSYFDRRSMEMCNTKNKIKSVLSVLRKYYVSHRSKNIFRYSDDLTFYQCVTVFRRFLLLYDYEIIGYNCKKFRVKRYFIKRINIPKTLKIQRGSIIIHLD
jgi:hypothetical protein